MPDPNQIDAYIQSAADGFTQIYQTIRPPAQPPVTPVVYTTQAPAGGAALGVDLNSLVWVALIAVGVYWVLKH
jgi:hypothetical protein